MKHLHARILAKMSPQLRAKHAAKVSSRRYKVGSSAGNVLGWPAQRAGILRLRFGLLTICCFWPQSGLPCHESVPSSWVGTDNHMLHKSNMALHAAHATDWLCGLQGSPDLRHVTCDTVWPLPDCAPQTEAPLLCGLQVGPDLCQDLGAVQAAIRAYRPHLARCTNPTAAASGHPAQSAPATAAAASSHTPSPRQDARPLPGLQSERGSVDEPSFSAAAGHAAGQRQQLLHSSARVNLDSHLDAAAADAAGREQQAPLTPVEAESEATSPASSAGSSPGHGTSQLEVQPKSPLPPAPAPTRPAVPTHDAAQAQAETPAVTAVTDGPAECSAGGQAAACRPGPEPGTSQPKRGRARRW